MDYSNSSGSKVKMSIRLPLVMAILICLAGCTDQVLYSHLTEREANEMVALLYNKGINAEKSSQGDNTYSISTSPELFAQAVELLSSNGYPKNHFESLGDVFKKEGFVSSPLEERARLNYAQSQELARTIESIDGVVLARVHLAIPEDNGLNETRKPSSASVFLKHKRGLDLSGREAQIKALVVNSIEGLPYENVTVAMFSTDPIPSFTKPKEPAGVFGILDDDKKYLLVLLIVLVALLVGASYWLLKNSKKKMPQYNVSKSGM